MSSDIQSGWDEAHEKVTPWTPGTEPRPGLRLAWEAGRAPVVRVKGAEVLRISEVIAADVLDTLKTCDIPLGPVLINLPRRCVEVLVPLGTATTWPRQQNAACAAIALMRCPAPHVTRVSGRWSAGRTWTRSPDTSPVTTNAIALAEAVPRALARWHDALEGRMQVWGGDRPTPGPSRRNDSRDL